MTAPIISLADDDLVDRVAAVLERGELVVLPTDTVYGVAARPGDRSATERLFAAKGRGQSTPVAVLCSDAAQALGLADQEAAARAVHAADRFWPGPLTLVLSRRPGAELHLGDPADTVGLRVPDHDVVQAIARRVGPIATSSANRHREPTPATAHAAAEALGDAVSLVVDGGRLEGSSSTVVDTTTVPWTMLREGPIPASEILRAR